MFQCDYNKQNVVSQATIRNRCNSCTDKFPGHRGVKSPLHSVEESICEILIEIGKIRQPLSVIESIELVNSLIKGSDVEEELIAFKKTTIQKLIVNELEKVGGLGF